MDAYGRLFVGGYGLWLYSSALGQNPEAQLSDNEVHSIAFDPSTNALYSFEENEGIYLIYRDLSGASTVPYDVIVSSEAQLNDSYGLSLAAGAGFMYAPVFSSSQDAYGIGKFAVTKTGESAQATVVAFTPFSAIGIDYASGLKVNDMIVRDGVLYIAAAVHGNPNGNVYPYYLNSMKSRGKVIALSTADLTKLWEVGMTDTPVPTSPATEFYGPARFVGVAPRKLYVADEGFSWEDSPSYYDQVTDVNRVVEINLDTGEIEAIGLNGEATFFENFTGYYAVGVNYSA
jgi:hypothetical protein